MLQNRRFAVTYIVLQKWGDNERLGQFEQGNAARGRAGEMEAARRRAREAMTSR
jgi:hypothetical protein